MEDTGPTCLEPGGTNSIGRMLGLLGDEWTLLLVQQALQGRTRYGQFKGALPISDAVLSARLRALSAAGLLDSCVYQSNPTRAEYVVTPRSRSLWPVMLSIWEWERQWVAEHTTPLPTMHHTACGHDFAPVLSCRSCGKPVGPRDVDARWGPSGSWARSVPAAATRRRPDPDAPHTHAGLFPETMTIVGNRWSSALIGAAFRGVHRFTDFESSLGAPPALVADRLRAFCGIGVLESQVTHDHSGRAWYVLTEKGRAFFPVVVAGVQWAERWFVAPEGAALRPTHRTCGDSFVAVLGCDRCEGLLAGREIRVDLASGA